MISNESGFARRPQRPQHYSDRRPYADRQQQPERPRPAFEVLAERVVEGDRKRFSLTRRKNAAGEFIQIVEERNGRHNMVVIPAESAAAVLAALTELVGTAH